MSFPRLSFIAVPLVLGAALTTGACGAPVAVTGASYAADGGLLVASEKTSADHMISMVSKQDCALWRVIKGRAVCKPRVGDKDPYNVDYDSPDRMVSEAGTQYTPPLRAQPDAPAASWDAAAYRTAAPPATPSAPVTAVAEDARGAQPAVAAEPPPSPAAPTASAKPKKPKTHSVKRASRGRAAPPS